jgi:hypothetical protein
MTLHGRLGAYAALVKRPGAEEIYPADSILLCVPMARYPGSIIKGRCLVIERFQEARLEVTVREVLADGDGRLWRSQRSSDPRLQGAVKMPAELGPEPPTQAAVLPIHPNGETGRAGQAAICNNMILVSMIAVGEAFVLAPRRSEALAYQSHQTRQPLVSRRCSTTCDVVHANIGRDRPGLD